MDDLAQIESKLNTISVDRYLDVHYDKADLFKRALFVFRSSYYGYESLTDNRSYRAKFEEYVDLMWKVFWPDDNDALTGEQLHEWLEEIDKQIERSDLVVTIAVDHCQTADHFVRTKIVVHNSVDQVCSPSSRHSVPNSSDTNTDSTVVRFALKLPLVRQLRLENKVLRVEMYGERHDTGEPVQLTNALTVPYLTIHPEGFRTWFEFDHCTRALVTIGFAVCQPNYTHTRRPLTEHTQLVWHLFKHRFAECSRRNYNEWALAQSNHKCDRRTTSLMAQVNPHSSDAFWSCVESGSVESQSVESQSEASGRTTCSNHCHVHCHELQLAYDQTDEPIEEEFCRCTEWCNVSSFYYHNPVFRFLMVQFTNSYVQTNANLPSSYMLAVSHLFREQCAKQQIPISLLHILNSILNYMKLSYSKKIQFLVIDVCSYKLLRSVAIDALVVQVSEHREPFNAQLVQCINTYYQILTYLHSHIAKMRQIVPIAKIDDWYNLLCDVVCQGYDSYLYMNTKIALGSVQSYCSIALIDTDTTSVNTVLLDPENGLTKQNFSPTTEFHQRNVFFKCDSFFQVIQNVSKFIVDVYPSIVNNVKKTQRCNFAIKLDRLLTKELPRLDRLESGECFILQICGTPKGRRMAKKLHMLFTLKLYSFAFAIQQYITKSLLDYNQVACVGYLMYVPERLHFVFSTDWIEQTYTQTYPMEHLFFDKCKEFEKRVSHFYNTVWPVSKHKPSVIDVTLQECCKLCLWWHIDGRKLSVFGRLVNTFCRLVIDCVTRANHLFVFELEIGDTVRLQNGHNCLVQDDLVLKLVQATCFYLVKAVHSLVKSVHAIQNTHQKYTLTLVRPGVIELVATIDIVLQQLNQLKSLFIAFNDESNSICQTIDFTEFTVVALYRDLYFKLLSDWHEQVKTTIKQALSQSSIKIATMLHFLLIIEMHFTIRFHRFFRQDYISFKQEILKLTNELQNIRYFDLVLYKKNLDQLFEFETNCTSSTPFLENSLDSLVFEALAINKNNKPPFEQLKEFHINTDLLI